MEPNRTDRPATNLTRDPFVDPFDEAASPVDNEPTISSDPLSVGNTLSVGPAVAPRGEPGGPGRSIATWALPLFILTSLALVLFIALRPRPIDNGNTRPTDNDAVPNVPLELKR